MAIPMRMAISNPGRMRLSDTSMNFKASVPDSVIVAGTQRSIFPGPSVMTNIWPMPTMTEKAAKVSAACDRPNELAPPAKSTVMIQTGIEDYGNAKLTFTVDWLNQVAESNESNNQYIVDFSPR